MDFDGDYIFFLHTHMLTFAVPRHPSSHIAVWCASELRRRRGPPPSPLIERASFCDGLDWAGQLGRTVVCVCACVPCLRRRAADVFKYKCKLDKHVRNLYNAFAMPLWTTVAQC